MTELTVDERAELDALRVRVTELERERAEQIAAASAALAADEPLVKGLLIGEKASPSCRAPKLPYSLGMARYTMWNTPFDRALDITEALDCRYMSLIEGSIARDASDAEIEAYKARLAKRGITVDNFSVRSNNGHAIFGTGATVNRQIDEMLGYDLVVL